MDAVVPCGSCTACCRSQLVAVMPEDAPNANHYRTRSLGKMESGDDVLVLVVEADGNCTHLVGGKCEVYDVRPIICRTYDCREQFRKMTRNQRRQHGCDDVWRAARRLIAAET